jgi:surface antigen
MNKFKRLSSLLATVATISTSAIAISTVSTLTSPVPPVQAATCTFSGRAMFQVNVRADRTTSSRVVKTLNVGTYQFSGYEIGQAVNDFWVGTPDSKWFRLSDGSGWVASAMINGNPPSNCGGSITTGGNFSAPNWGSAAYRSNNPFWRAYAPASVGGNLGTLGNCTWYANGRLRELGYNSGQLSRLTGNAADWSWQARNAGIQTGTTPRVGAVAQHGRNYYGHVAVVERINNDGTITISQSSWATSGPSNYLYKTENVNPGFFSTYIYVSK